MHWDAIIFPYLISSVQPPEDTRIDLEGQVIEEGERFEHSRYYNGGYMRKEVAIRIGKTGTVISKMRKTRLCRGITLKAKLKLFKEIVLYCCTAVRPGTTWKRLKKVFGSLKTSICEELRTSNVWTHHCHWGGSEEKWPAKCGAENKTPKV